jgi:peroxiredoxin
MKRTLMAAAAAVFLLSCSSEKGKGKFTLNGELTGSADQKIYLEQLFFGEKDPEVLDTADVKSGKFSLTTVAPEEGLYRLRLEKDKTAYFFVNDNNQISFKGDINTHDLSGWNFSGSANSSLKALLKYSDSIYKNIDAAYSSMMRLQEAKVSETDSSLITATTMFNIQKEELSKYCFKYSDTAASPTVALFAARVAPVDLDKLQIPVQHLSTRFPKNNGIASALAYLKTKSAEMQQSQEQPNAGLPAGTMAPPINMTDVNDKPFTLDQLRGKYVLIDFWASWCAPCRGENPNVVAAYNQFKDKNFTVLGVSLDDNKEKWKEAIAADKLTWQHVSDLKDLNNSPITNIYGFNSIPFNVLIDPQGKVVACGLRGPALQAKLAEVLK